MNALTIKVGQEAPIRLGAETVIRYEQGSASLTVRRRYCKSCVLCIDACPTKILELDRDELIYVNDISKCVFCGACAGRCPDFVFVLDTGKGER